MRVSKRERAIAMAKGARRPKKEGEQNDHGLVPRRRERRARVQANYRIEVEEGELLG